MSPVFLVLMGASLPCGFHTKPGRIEVGVYATFQQPAAAAVREAAREELAAVGDADRYRGALAVGGRQLVGLMVESGCDGLFLGAL